MPSEWTDNNGKPVHAALPHGVLKPRKYGLLFFYRILAIKHLFMIGLMLGVAFLGGLIFYSISADTEHQTVTSTIAAVEAKLSELTNNITETVILGRVSSLDEATVRQLLKEMYIDLQETEGIYKNSAFYKDGVPSHLEWQWWPAVFYASNIYMTVGYGTLICNTTRGMVLSVVYAFISIPFLNIVVRDLGQWLQVVSTKVYGKCLIRFRKSRGVKTDPSEEIVLPISITLMYFLLNLLFCGLLTYGYDHAWGAVWGPKGGTSYWGAVYYSFITLSSIGMSDFPPINATTSALPVLWYVLSLPIFKMSLRVVYIAMENGILGTLAVIEWQLAKWDGYYEDLNNSTIETNMSSGTLSEEKNPNGAVPYDVGHFIQSHADAYAGDFGRVRLRQSNQRPERELF